MKTKRRITTVSTWASAMLLVASALPVDAAPPLAFVTSTANDSVSVFDTATNTVVDTIEGFGSPFYIAISPDGTRAYVSNEDLDTISVIDTATRTVVATIPVGDSPRGVAFTPDGTRAYVANILSNTVSVIDVATNAVVATIPRPAPNNVAVTPDGSRLYVTQAQSMSVIDTATNTVLDAFALPGIPSGVDFSPDGAFAYVVKIAPSVSVLETVGNTEVAVIPRAIKAPTA